MPLRKTLWLPALLLVFLAGALLFAPRRPDLPKVVILPPTPFVGALERIPERWIPPTWGGLRRWCQLLFGAPRTIGFDMKIIEVSNTVERLIAQANLGPPAARSNGVAVWLTHGGRAPWTPGSSFTMSSSVQTIDGIQATMFMLGNGGNYMENFFPRLRARTVDLSVRFVLKSLATTNFAAAARAQLPYGGGLFLLDDRLPELDTNREELFITADELDVRGNKVAH